MAQMSTITMMLANDAIGLPDSSEEFRGYPEGYAVILLALCSEHNRAVQDYRANILDHQSKIITYIEQMFPNVVHHCTAWAVVLMYIYRMMNDYLTRLLTAQPPTITGTPAVGAPPVAPDFSYIMEELVSGRLLQITSLPDVFFEMPAAPLPMPQWLGPTGSSGAGDGGSSSGTGGGGDRPKWHVIVQCPNQNLELKSAWAATGITGIYSLGSPFCDKSMPKKVHYPI